VHGHIHETVRESGDVYSGLVGARTVVLAVGNDFHAATVACLILDTTQPHVAERLLLPTPAV
jgi:hypothetical protein